MRVIPDDRNLPLFLAARRTIRGGLIIPAAFPVCGAGEELSLLKRKPAVSKELYPIKRLFAATGEFVCEDPQERGTYSPVEHPLIPFVDGGTA